MKLLEKKIEVSMLKNHPIYILICTKGWTSVQSTAAHTLERGNIYIIIYNVYTYNLYILYYSICI